MKVKDWKIRIRLDKETPEEIRYKNLWEVYDAILNDTEKQNKLEKVEKK